MAVRTDIDLTPFSLGGLVRWIGLLVVLGGLMGGILLGVAIMGLGSHAHSDALVGFGVLVMLAPVVAIFAGIILTIKQRLSSSVSGSKRAFVRLDDMCKAVPGFDKPLAEIVAA